MPREKGIQQEYEGKQFKADCPHCLTKSVAFTTLDVVPQPGSSSSYDVFAECGYEDCARTIIATFSINDLTERFLSIGMLRKPDCIVPASPSSDAPPYTPDPAAKYFKQGRDSNMSGNWDAAGAMFRKALEAALTDKFPDLSGTLHSRIQKATEQHALTPDLAEWSHEIRNEGNKAVHDEGPYQEEEARRLEAFTDMVFQYLFSLPGMLKQKKQQPSPQQDGQKERKESS